MKYALNILVLLVLFISGCNQFKKKGFLKLSESRTGISFKNELFESDTINGNTFEYLYNGAGVGVADFNNDGLPDIYFAGNMVSSGLFLNQGNMIFKEFTKESNTQTDRWCTGISIIDINGDGWKDIYVNVAGFELLNDTRENYFFINQGLNENSIPVFEDKAVEMGLNDNGYSTMSAFFDFDKDGDLDIYILSISMDGTNRSMIREIMKDGSAESTDRLYRNNGNGFFENISVQAGITYEGYGLGLGIFDINMDGWLDVYCANDFISNDLLYINNQDGTFSEESGRYFKHFTHNGMGMDVADVNNDALPDVFVLDMLPKENARQKLMITSNANTFNESVKSGYHPQFLRNTLQLNRGLFPDGQFHFSEISFLAGTYQTDWSWAPLFADFDHDGWKDLFITNGFRKDVTDLDYIDKIIQITRFGTPEARKILLKQELDKLADVKLLNHFFKNNGDLTFSDVTKSWGLEELTFTNGAALADFDNDGDLDIVMNNLDQPASIYENRLSEFENQVENNHYLKILFSRVVADSQKIGLKVWLYQKGEVQYIQYSPFRGYKSTMDEYIHFGLGANQNIDSLILQWHDGRMQKFEGIQGSKVMIIEPPEITAPILPLQKNDNSVIQFSEQTSECNLNIVHESSASDDWKVTSTLLHSLSHYGPSLSVGDVNGDNLEDVFMGGDAGHYAKILIQNPDATFSETIFAKDSLFHDMGSLLFDADNDGDLDLYVVSGGYQLQKGHPNYQDRLYINDGFGNFGKSSLPEISSSGSCVVSADFDLDGDLDLFVGGRVEGRNYPSVPQSYLLVNKNGIFEDMSHLLGNENGRLGMVTSAIWTDVDSDGRPDIIAVGEWMHPTVLINTDQGFIDKSKQFQTDILSGWWNSIAAADFDNDGDIDYVLGNYGLNSFYKASFDFPLEMYASDLDKNGTLDPVITHYSDGNKYVVHPFAVLRSQVPGIIGRFPKHSNYANATFEYSFTDQEVKESQYFKAHTLETIVLENKDGKWFELKTLPVQIQFSPVFGLLIDDLNRDGYQDIMAIGNSMHEETTFGNYDASYGSILINKGDFQWESAEPSHTNFNGEGDKRALVSMPLADGNTAFIMSDNGGSLKSYILEYPPGQKIIRAETDDWYITYSIHGKKTKREFYYGEGFLSGSSRSVMVPAGANEVQISKFNGQKRFIHF